MPDEILSTEPSTEPGSKTTRLRKLAKRVPLDFLPLIVLLVVVFLEILFANEWKFWDGMLPMEETNDAYIRSDVTPLSTKVSGTVARVLIDDFDTVKKGQLLVELRNDDFIARERESKSAYDQALANIETIKSQLEVQKQRIEDARFTVGVGVQDVTRAYAGVGSTQATLQ